MTLKNKDGTTVRPEDIFQGYADIPDDFDYAEMLRATAEAERIAEMLRNNAEANESLE